MAHHAMHIQYNALPFTLLNTTIMAHHAMPIQYNALPFTLLRTTIMAYHSECSRNDERGRNGRRRRLFESMSPACPSSSSAASVVELTVIIKK